MDLFNKLGDSILLILAGLAGGIAGARAHPEATKGVVNFAWYIVVGFLFAVFAAPAVAELWGIKSDRVIAGLGFFAAILWLPLAERAKTVISTINIPFWKGGAK